MATNPKADLGVKQNRLTIALVVRDEAGRLSRSLESIEAWSDQIFVMDIGSEDLTVEVCRKHQVARLAIDWASDFSAVRNELFRGDFFFNPVGHDAHDWILWLEAGETLTSHEAAKLVDWVHTSAQPDCVYHLLVESPPEHPRLSRERIQEIRLIPFHSDWRFEGRVRETLEPSIDALGFSKEMAPATIQRDGDDHLPERKTARALRDLELSAIEIAESETVRPAVQIARGQALYDLNQKGEARKSFRSAIASSKLKSTERLEAYLGLLSTYQGGSTEAGPFLQVAVEALEEFPLDSHLLFFLGTVLQSQGQTDLAARTFQTVIDHGQVNLETWHLAEIAEMTVVSLSLVWQLQGKKEEAEKLIDQALSFSPESSRVARHAIDLKVKMGKRQKAIELIDRLPLNLAQRRAYTQAVRGAAEVVERQFPKAIDHLENARENGCDGPFCLRWLAAAYLLQENHKAAKVILDAWQKQEPDNPEITAYLAAISPLAEAAFGTPQEIQSAEETTGLDEVTRETTAESGYRIDSAATTSDLQTGRPSKNIESISLDTSSPREQESPSREKKCPEKKN